MNRHVTKPVPVSNKLGGVIFMLIALVILGFASYLLFQIWEFGTEGVYIVGIIDGRHIEYTHGRGAGAFPELQYHYVAGGATYARTSKVTSDTYGQFHPGDTVPIVFLSKEPSESRLDLAPEKQREWDNVWGWSLIGLPLFLFAAFIYRLPTDSTHARNP